MNLRNINFLASAAIVALACATSSAHAALVTWNIDSTQSSLSLKIGDTAFNVDGIGNITIRVRNQATNQNNAWNTGNTAKVGGTIDTNYVDGTSIEFLANQPNIVGVNSGNYRPNPASYTGDTNPDPTLAEGGSFSDTSTQAAVFGARVRASIASLFGLTVDAAFINFFNVNYELASGVLGLSGTNSNFTNSTTVGILDSRLAVDGLTVVGQTVIDDQIAQVDNATAANSGALGTLTDLGGQLRKITIPVLLNLVIPLDDTNTYVLNAQATGQIVATAEVQIPEPSTFAMAGLGVVGLMLAARRKLGRQRA
jgi:hypothetical protein